MASGCKCNIEPFSKLQGLNGYNLELMHEIKPWYVVLGLK